MRRALRASSTRERGARRAQFCVPRERIAASASAREREVRGKQTALEQQRKTTASCTSDSCRARSRRKPAFLHRAEYRHTSPLRRPRIVCGDRQTQITMETIEQALDVTRAAPNILRRVVRIGNAQFGGGSRFELHQPLRAGFGSRARIERRLVGDDGLYQRRVDPPSGGVRRNEVIDLLRRQRRRPGPRGRFLSLPRPWTRTTCRYRPPLRRNGSGVLSGDFGNPPRDGGDVAGDVHGVHLKVSARAARDDRARTGLTGCSPCRNKNPSICASSAIARSANASAGMMPRLRASSVCASTDSAPQRGARRRHGPRRSRHSLCGSCSRARRSRESGRLARVG